MNQSSAFLFESKTVWGELLRDSPNPKPSKKDRDKFGKLVSLYTAFSVDFCDFIINTFYENGYTKILDPFAGMGSLGEAARKYPVDLTLNDLNPFAPLSCIARTSDFRSYDVAAEILQNAVNSTKNNGEQTLFLDCAQNIMSLSGLTPESVNSDAFLKDHREHALAMFMLCASRIRYYKSKKGTNPTWTKKLDEKETDSERFETATNELVYEVQEFGKNLNSCAPGFSSKVVNNNILSNDPSLSGFDAIITSPPYPNRTDYYKHYLPASDLLTQLSKSSERLFREDQIGTPLIRKGVENLRTTRRIDTLIDQIRNHESYASSSYYWKGFYYYFSDMNNFFKVSRNILNDNGKLVFVVQDTLYKDIYIPVADLLSELAEKNGFKVEEIRSWAVKTRLSSMSPHTSKPSSNKRPVESVVILSK